MSIKLTRELKAVSPYLTGNLRKNAINQMQFSSTEAGAVVGGVQAPYATILEYAGAITYKTKTGTITHANRHQGWGYNVAMQVAQKIAKAEGGSVQ